MRCFISLIKNLIGAMGPISDRASRDMQRKITVGCSPTRCEYRNPKYLPSAIVHYLASRPRGPGASTRNSLPPPDTRSAFHRDPYRGAHLHGIHDSKSATTRLFFSINFRKGGARIKEKKERRRVFRGREWTPRAHAHHITSP